MRWHLRWTLWTCLLAAVCRGSGSAPPDGERLLLFVIEKYWDNSTALGEGGYCSSGGFNHAQALLTSYLAIGSAVASKRRAVVLRPAFIFTRVNGRIPESVRWADMFRWDVDTDEFQSPKDVWSAWAHNSSRFHVFDIFEDPTTLIHRIQMSQAEVALIHMCVCRYMLMGGWWVVGCRRAVF
jgi:hypothetical protein